MVMRAAILLALAACHVRGPAVLSSSFTGAQITLYRDGAVVQQSVELDARGSNATVAFDVPADVTELAVVDARGATITGVHVPVRAPADPDQSDDSLQNAEAAPRKATIDASVPRPGRYAIAVEYVTAQLTWSASYEITASRARDRATLHGAIAVTNASGLALPRVALRLVDAPVAGWRAHARELLASAIVGEAASTTPVATPRELGEVALDRGETRVDLRGISTPRAMRSVLVYDPIGTTRDNLGALPLRDPSLGVSPPASSEVHESFEIARDAAATAGLPAGPVALYELAPNGSLELLGQARLFDDATRVAAVDTIPIGTATGVTGHRERRELTVEDEVRHRVTEEFVITIDNARDRPVDVLVREHLYRGQTWLIAYESTNRASKEGAQQIALRTEVPARSKAEVTYVVVYFWKP
ncbi:MAG TPA: hypothetical protein VGG74_18335 [Kofleriaceae bacterium]